MTAEEEKAKDVMTTEKKKSAEEKKAAEEENANEALAAEKKQAAKKKKAADGETLAHGCNKCRGQPTGCVQCKNPAFSGKRFRR